MVSSLKELYKKLLEIEVEEDIIPMGSRVERILVHIEEGLYEEALHYMTIYLIKAIVETKVLTKDEKILYIDELIKILDLLPMPQKDINTATRRFMKILLKYLRALEIHRVFQNNPTLNKN